MATRKIILDFKTQPIANSYFQYQVYVNGSLLVYDNSQNIINLKYVDGLSALTSIPIGVDLDETIDNTINHFSFFNYEYSGSLGTYPVSVGYARVGNTIEVSINIEISGDLENKITFWKVLSDYEYLLLKPSNACNFVYFSNAISESQASYIYSGSLINTNYKIKNLDLNTSRDVQIPFGFGYPLERGYSYALQYVGSNISTFSVPASLVSENVTLYFLVNDLYIIISGSVTAYTYLFSINGTDYQYDNLFEGLAEGTYTVYIKDSLGCVKTFTITNEGEGTNTNNVYPYYLVPDANSIRFKRSVTHGNCGNYKNRFNTLSCEENTPIANRFVQLFQTCDSSIKTQLKTSYQNVEVGAGETEITPVKIVRNIGIEDKRDVTYLNYNGSLALTYTSGNLYEYGTSTIIGTYELNGLLPDYGKIGTWLETAYGNLQISNILINDSGNRILILNSNAVPTTPIGTVQTIYNRENFDIWEFELNMGEFEDMMFNVGIRLFQDEPDENFPDVYFVSEKIQVKERWPRTLEMTWRNTKNTDVYFFSGITFKNRLAFADISTYFADGTIENQRTDTQVISIDASNYNGAELEINNLTTAMVQKINLALKHDTLTIEGIAYKLQDNPELERQGKSNFYKLTAKLLEAGDVWNNGTLNQQIYVNTELIGLLESNGDNEYIQIK